MNSHLKFTTEVSFYLEYSLSLSHLHTLRELAAITMDRTPNKWQSTFYQLQTNKIFYFKRLPNLIIELFHHLVCFNIINKCFADFLLRLLHFEQCQHLNAHLLSGSHVVTYLLWLSGILSISCGLVESFLSLWLSGILW